MMLTTLFLAVLAPEGETQQAAVAEVNLLPYITALVVFVLAFAVLWVAVWPKITKALDERDAKIRDEIRSAEESRKQAQQALQDYQKSLAEAREEAQRMIAQARADAKATAEELRRKNESELGEMKQRATNEIETAKRQAIRELHAESATLAVAIASRILSREISVTDQQKLVSESLEELGGLSRS